MIVQVMTRTMRLEEFKVTLQVFTAARVQQQFRFDLARRSQYLELARAVPRSLRAECERPFPGIATGYRRQHGGREKIKWMRKPRKRGSSHPCPLGWIFSQPHCVSHCILPDQHLQSARLRETFGRQPFPVVWTHHHAISQIACKMHGEISPGMQNAMFALR
jgi:hypothetical protein